MAQRKKRSTRAARFGSDPKQHIENERAEGEEARTFIKYAAQEADAGECRKAFSNLFRAAIRAGHADANRIAGRGIGFGVWHEREIARGAREVIDVCLRQGTRR